MIKAEMLNPLRWNRRFLFGVLFAFLFVWIGFLDNYSLYTRYQLNKEKSELENKIEQLRVETQELETVIEALRTDPAYLEKVAREEYGMRRPGETVYQIREK